MAAANIGYSGAKSEFQSSTVKKNTDFYRNYVSGKLTDENFKWPECPWKFVTKNHLIGAIQSPDRSEIEYDSNEVPQSPCSSNSVSLSPRPSTSNQLMSDMVKMIKGAKEEAKSEVKVETPTVPNMGTYGYIFPYGYPFNPMNMTMNPAMMPMPNMLPNMPMVGMPPHAPLQVHIINRIQNISFALHPLCYNRIFILFFQVVGRCDTSTESSRNSNGTYLHQPEPIARIEKKNRFQFWNLFLFSFCIRSTPATRIH